MVQCARVCPSFRKLGMNGAPERIRTAVYRWIEFAGRIGFLGIARAFLPFSFVHFAKTEMVIVYNCRLFIIFIY
jgi:hypothetical protein